MQFHIDAIVSTLGFGAPLDHVTLPEHYSIPSATLLAISAEWLFDNNADPHDIPDSIPCTGVHIVGDEMYIVGDDGSARAQGLDFDSCFCFKCVRAAPMQPLSEEQIKAITECDTVDLYVDEFARCYANTDEKGSESDKNIALEELLLYVNEAAQSMVHSSQFTAKVISYSDEQWGIVDLVFASGQTVRID